MARKNYDLQPYLRTESVKSLQSTTDKKNKVRVSDIVGGVLARFLFFCHSICGVVLGIATAGLDPPVRYSLILLLGPQIIEAVVTLWYRRGREWKWVTPSILFHITATVPTIWVMELQEVEKRIISRRMNSSDQCVDLTQMDGTAPVKFTSISHWASYMVEEFCDCGNCITIMVQLLLLLLVIGRWLCPRSGTVSAAQKAVMLFHNFAVTSDILDLYRLLKEDKVKYDPMLVTVTLCLWTSGIIQIAIVVTAKKEGSRVCGACLDNGVWAILAVLFLDDIPFLMFRLVLIAHYHVFSYTIFFFTCKNLLLTALNTNKLIAIAHEHKKEVREQHMMENFRQLIEQPAEESSAVVKIEVPARSDKTNLPENELREGRIKMVQGLWHT